MNAAGKALLRGGGLIAAGFALVVVVMLLIGNGASDPMGGGDTAPGPAGDPAAGAAGDPDLSCTIARAGATLPAETHETSGLARSTRIPEIFWTHNDSGDRPRLYALHAEGGLAGTVDVAGASAEDWEDLEAAPCPDSNEPCLYIADMGDNEAERDRITIYVVPEPAPGEASVQARAFHARYPEGPRDAEGLFIADGRIHIVTKGREGPIRLYRFPAEAQDGTATLEPVAELAPRPGSTVDYVTAATASDDGRWIATRTYRTLTLYEADPLLAGEPGPGRSYDLAPLREAQGESVVLGDDGQVWMTSEGRGGASPSWSRLVCQLPE